MTATSQFDLLYLRNAAAVRRLGVSILASPDAADDLVQDTFLQLWRHWAEYSSELGSTKTWLFAVARNRAIDMLRAQARHTRRVEAARSLAHVAEHSPGPLAQAISRDEVVRLHAALAHLPPAQRRTLLLAHGVGLTHEQVAQRTGVPLGTVKGRLRLGRRNVAGRLEPGRRTEAPIAG